MKAPASDILRQANEVLGSHDFHPDGLARETQWPACFIAAPPRGGSTLLQQVLISAFKFGYVSNLMARFWNVPALGAALQSEFAPVAFRSSFVSKFGNTDGQFEPHEWGWFWRKWLSLEGNEHHITRTVDWRGLKSTLAILERILGAPLLFDSPLAGSNLPEVSDGLGKILVLNLSRSPWYVCNSLLNARIERYGTLDAHYGATVKNQQELERVADPIEQIVRQAWTLIDEQARQVAELPTLHVLHLRYEKLRADPMAVIDQVETFYESHGISLERMDLELEPFPDRNRHARINAKFADALSTQVERYFGADAVPK